MREMMLNMCWYKFSQVLIIRMTVHSEIQQQTVWDVHICYLVS